MARYAHVPFSSYQQEYAIHTFQDQNQTIQPYAIHLGVAALRAAGAPAAEAVVVEDSIAGVESAKAAGLRCVSVGHSYPLERLRGAGADAAVAHLRELTDAILDGEPG